MTEEREKRHPERWRGHLKTVGAVALAAACGLASASAGASTTAGAPADKNVSAAEAQASAAGPSFHHVMTREGIEVELSLDSLATPGAPLVEADSVQVRVRVRDTHTGEPLPSLYPAGWLDRLAPGTETSADDCREKVASFIGGGFLSRAELDLNAFYVLALNDEASISVVDPLFGFGGSKLLTTIKLPSRGADWAMSRDQERLFVTLPARDQVAVAETASWKVVTFADTGPAPRRIVAQPDGAFLWAAYAGDDEHPGGVSVISTTALKTVAEIETGDGEHDIAFSADGAFVYVTNKDADTVSVIDTATQQPVATLDTGPSPVSVAYSELAAAAFVTDEGGAITVIDGRHEIAARIEAGPGLGRIRFAPGGRWGFVPVPSSDAVHIVDAAKRRVVQTAGVEQGPVEVAFSDQLAYVSHSRSETVLMIPLTGIGKEGQPVHIIDFPGGTNPPGDNPFPSPAAAIVQAPGAPAVLIANPRDRSIFFYKEGMAAPMGHFQNYGRMPRAVRVVDRSLREVAPGTYQTAVNLRRPGQYNLAFFLDSPRVVECVPLTVAADPDLAAERSARRHRVRPMIPEDTTVPVGENLELSFRITNPDSGASQGGLEDVTIMVMATGGNWHRRFAADELEPGVYGVKVAPPEAGLYYVFVGAPSLGLGLNENPYTIFTVEPATIAAANAGPSLD